YERGGEFGGLGWPTRFPPGALALRLKGDGPRNTTIAVVATDATLDKAACKRLAVAAHDGLARALRPAHLPMDGDTVFAAATAARPAPDPRGFAELCALAADALARAIARGVYEAKALPFAGALPAWRDKFGGRHAAP
ncbi:MAG: P1 family peptidase, partial [Hyphomicrobiales bacterium]|nr:P1 family peptidase [Hyphomicrobiales bacterium]